MWTRLGRFFGRHPLIANSALYGTILVSAELTQQTLTRKLLVEDPSKKKPYDVAAFGRYAVLGYFITPQIAYRCGPDNDYRVWYVWLDATFVGTAGRVVAKKVLLDSFVASPPMMFVFFTSLAFMEGRRNVLDEFRYKFPVTYGLSLCFWLPVQTVNFFLVPAKGRIGFIAVSAFFWSTVLTYIKQRSHLASVRQ